MFDLFTNAFLSLVESHKEHVHVFKGLFIFKFSSKYGVVEIPNEYTLVDGCIVVVVILVKRVGMHGLTSYVDIVFLLVSHSGGHR